MIRYEGAVILALAMLVSSCGSTSTTSATPSPAPSGKDAILTFDRQVAPIGARYEQLIAEWNTWQERASQAEYERNLRSRAEYMDSEMEKLHDSLVKVAAPQELVRFKNLFASAIAKNIEGFSYAQEYARSGNETYRIRADSAVLEAKKLYSLAADEWDVVKAQYELR